MLRSLAALVILASTLLATSAWTTAYFSDTETSTDNTFVAGDIDLLVSSQCHYWQNGIDVGCGEGAEFGNWETTNIGEVFKFFNFNDIKPGDYGENTIDLVVESNDAYVCTDVTLTSNAENGFTQPETLVDTPDDGQFDGELAGELYMLLWADDGDNVLEEDEYATSSAVPASIADLVGEDLVYTQALADSSTNIWTGVGGPISGGVPYYVGTAWCFGEFVINPLPQADGYNPSDNPGFACDGTNQTNITQTDIVTGDISFSAVQARNNPDFVCGQDTTCSFVEETWVNSVVSYTPGTNKDGSPILDSRDDPEAAVGPAEGTNAIGTFVSLGFGGSIVLEFEHAIEDLDGPDLSFHEITNLPYPTESAEVAVSQNGVDFTPIGSVSNIGSPLQYLDIAGAYPWIKFVRVTDTTDPELHDDTADGYDVDGLDAQNYNVCLLPE